MNVLKSTLATTLGATLLLVGACQQVPKLPGSSVEVLTDGAALMSLSPADVVVAPVEVMGNADKPPVQMLRRSFQVALVDRRYSPLATSYVDTGIIEAAYTPGTLDEEAVLQISVRSWSETLGVAHTSLYADIEAAMLDARTGETLWSGQLGKRYSLALDSVSSRQQIQRKVCNQIAEEIMAAMPARRTRP